MSVLHIGLRVRIYYINTCLLLDDASYIQVMLSQTNFEAQDFVYVKFEDLQIWFYTY